VLVHAHPVFCSTAGDVLSSPAWSARDGHSVLPIIVARPPLRRGRSAQRRIGHIPLSIGVAVVSLAECDEALLHRADGAMYHSEAAKRNRVAVCSKDLMEESRDLYTDPTASPR
jgi:hypothetical protein